MSLFLYIFKFLFPYQTNSSFVAKSYGAVRIFQARSTLWRNHDETWGLENLIFIKEEFKGIKQIF